MCLSLKGVKSIDTVKHLSNYLLSLLMNDWTKGMMVIEFLQEEHP